MIMPRDRFLPNRQIRAALVARIRREIQQGTYDTPEKLEIALQRMFARYGIDLSDEFPPSRYRRDRW